MSDSSLSPDDEHKYDILRFNAEVNEEDKKRRICTAFGYRLGGTNTMMIIMIVLVFVAGAFIMVFAAKAPSFNIPATSNPLFWWCFAPLGVIPLVPLLFLKLRYALMPIAISLVIAMGAFAVGGYSEMIRNWIVGQ